MNDSPPIIFTISDPKNANDAKLLSLLSGAVDAKFLHFQSPQDAIEFARTTLLPSLVVIFARQGDIADFLNDTSNNQAHWPNKRQHSFHQAPVLYLTDDKLNFTSQVQGDQVINYPCDFGALIGWFKQFGL